MPCKKKICHGNIKSRDFTLPSCQVDLVCGGIYTFVNFYL